MNRHHLDPMSASLFTNDTALRRRLNDALEAARDTEVSVQALQSHVEALAAVATAQGEYVTYLGVALNAMSQLLGDAGLLDVNALALRIEAIQHVMSPKPVTQSPPENRTENDFRTLPPLAITQCTVCRTEVALSDTLITENGAVCAKCYVPPG